MEELGENQSLLGWLLAGEVDLVIEALGFNSYFNQDERDKMRVLMQRISNQEQLCKLRESRGHL